MNIGSPQVSKAEMMDSFPAANIYLGKTSGSFSKRKYFCQKTRRYFILVTAETGPELYDPLNVTDKTITAKIPSRTHTRESWKSSLQIQILQIQIQNQIIEDEISWGLENLQQVCSLLSWLRQIIANWSPRLFIIAFWVHFHVFFSRAADEWPDPTTRGVFIWWPAVRFGYQLSWLSIIPPPNDLSGQPIKERPTLTMCLPPLTHSHPHNLPFTVPTPMIYPFPWDFRE